MNVVSLSERRPGARNHSSSRSSIFAALDIGTTKICCMIGTEAARRRGGGDGQGPALQVLGIGHQIARGVRAGAVVDMDAAERSIRAAVDAAERMAGVTVESVFVNVSGGRPKCETYGADMRIGGRAVTPQDIARIGHLARAKADPQGRTVVHAGNLGYALDGTDGINDPIAMFGDAFSVDISLITVDPGPMRNLAVCIERCHLQVDGMAIAPYAAGVSTLAHDEMQLGVTCIEMGGGTTGVGVFSEGKMVFADVIPIGGNHVTMDIARGLSTPLAHAERIKALYGSCLPSTHDGRELIAVPLVGERGTDTVNRIPKSMLTGIIQPRIEETFELIRDRIKASGFAHLGGRGLVLTGGASQITGAPTLASTVLGKRVRLAAPRDIGGLPEAAHGPAYAGVTGLLAYAADPALQAAADGVINTGRGPSAGYLRRVGQWIRESF